MNTAWVKDDLNTLFAGAPSIEEIGSLISTKVNRFNGKLYKYCSFSKDDSNHSLSNLRDGIIYFSKPSDFNDPFIAHCKTLTYQITEKQFPIL